MGQDGAGGQLALQRNRVRLFSLRQFGLLSRVHVTELDCQSLGVAFQSSASHPAPVIAWGHRDSAEQVVKEHWFGGYPPALASCKQRLGSHRS